MKLRMPTWPTLRDGILFFSGLAGLAYETVWRRPPDYVLLPIFASMFGTPYFIKRDDKDRTETTTVTTTTVDRPNDNSLGG